MGFHDLGSAPFAGAPVQYLALLQEYVHAPNDLLHRRIAVGAMTEEQVEIIYAQSAQGGVASFCKVLTAEPFLVGFVVFAVQAEERLAGYAICRAVPVHITECTAHYLLCTATLVCLGIVEEVDTIVVSKAHESVGRSIIDLARVGYPRAERQHAEL
jgi:hypothetical protein